MRRAGDRLARVPAAPPRLPGPRMFPSPIGRTLRESARGPGGASRRSTSRSPTTCTSSGASAPFKPASTSLCERAHRSLVSRPASLRELLEARDRSGLLVEAGRGAARDVPWSGHHRSQRLDARHDRRALIDDVGDRHRRDREPADPGRGRAAPAACCNAAHRAPAHDARAVGAGGIIMLPAFYCPTDRPDDPADIRNRRDVGAWWPAGRGQLLLGDSPPHLRRGARARNGAGRFGPTLRDGPVRHRTTRGP